MREGIKMLENITNISIGQVGAVLGIIITIIKGISSFGALISSYNIEIGLMTKKEQWKFQVTNLAILAFSVLFLNLLFCFVGVDEKTFLGMFICCIIVWWRSNIP